MISEKWNILEKITDCNGQLNEVVLEKYDLNDITLNFYVTHELDVQIRIINPLLFSFSRYSDVLGTYIITEAELEEIKKPNFHELEKLNYRFYKDLSVEKVIFLHIEGDISIDALCHDFEISEITEKSGY